METRIHELEAELDSENRRMMDATKNLKKSERRIQELTYQQEEDRKNHERMQVNSKIIENQEVSRPLKIKLIIIIFIFRLSFILFCLLMPFSNSQITNFIKEFSFLIKRKKEHFSFSVGVVTYYVQHALVSSNIFLTMFKKIYF